MNVQISFCVKFSRSAQLFSKHISICFLIYEFPIVPTDFLSWLLGSYMFTGYSMGHLENSWYAQY